MKHLALKVTTALAVSLPAITGAAVVAAPPAAAQPAAVRYAAPAVTDVATARAIILAETNAARAAAGLAPVVESNTLDAIAQDCSGIQATNGVMAHCHDYYTRYPAGWTNAAENVAYGQSAYDVVDAWLASPGHRANILNPALNYIGIGYGWAINGTTFFTQDFAGYPS